MDNDVTCHFSGDVYDIHDFSVASEWERLVSVLESQLREWVKLGQPSCHTLSHHGGLVELFLCGDPNLYQKETYHLDACLASVASNATGDVERLFGLSTYAMIRAQSVPEDYLRGTLSNVLLSGLLCAASAAGVHVPVFAELSPCTATDDVSGLPGVPAPHLFGRASAGSSTVYLTALHYPAAHRRTPPLGDLLGVCSIRHPSAVEQHSEDLDGVGAGDVGRSCAAETVDSVCIAPPQLATAAWSAVLRSIHEMLPVAALEALAGHSAGTAAVAVDVCATAPPAALVSDVLPSSSSLLAAAAAGGTLELLVSTPVAWWPGDDGVFECAEDRELSTLSVVLRALGDCAVTALNRMHIGKSNERIRSTGTAVPSSSVDSSPATQDPLEDMLDPALFAPPSLLPDSLRRRVATGRAIRRAIGVIDAVGSLFSAARPAHVEVPASSGTDALLAPLFTDRLVSMLTTTSVSPEFAESRLATAFPTDSLLALLSFQLLRVCHEHIDGRRDEDLVRFFKELWHAFVLSLEKWWRSAIEHWTTVSTDPTRAPDADLFCRVPYTAESVPDLRCNLLQQKLQMLTACVRALRDSPGLFCVPVASAADSSSGSATDGWGSDLHLSDEEGADEKKNAQAQNVQQSEEKEDGERADTDPRGAARASRGDDDDSSSFCSVASLPSGADQSECIDTTLVDEKFSVPGDPRRSGARGALLRDGRRQVMFKYRCSDAASDPVNDATKLIFVPKTLPTAPVTEDAAAQYMYGLSAFGSGPEAMKARAKAQLAPLLSDISSFKASNPNAALEDFVFWHSPRDVTPHPDDRSRAVLSARFEQDDNIWLRAWHDAPCRPASEQPPVFDPISTGEGVLLFLRNVDTAIVQGILQMHAITVALGSVNMSAKLVGINAVLDATVSAANAIATEAISARVPAAGLEVDTSSDSIWGARPFCGLINYAIIEVERCETALCVALSAGVRVRPELHSILPTDTLDDSLSPANFIPKELLSPLSAATAELLRISRDLSSAEPVSSYDPARYGPFHITASLLAPSFLSLSVGSSPIGVHVFPPYCHVSVCLIKFSRSYCRYTARVSWPCVGGTVPSALAPYCRSSQVRARSTTAFQRRPAGCTCAGVMARRCRLDTSPQGSTIAFVSGGVLDCTCGHRREGH